MIVSRRVRYPARSTRMRYVRPTVNFRFSSGVSPARSSLMKIVARGFDSIRSASVR
jgi:hypothetical protein